MGSIEGSIVGQKDRKVVGNRKDERGRAEWPNGIYCGTPKGTYECGQHQMSG